MRRRIELRVECAEPDVRAAAVEVLGAVPGPDGTLRVSRPELSGSWIEVRLAPGEGAVSTLVTLEGTADLPIPFFGWAIRPLIRLALRRAVADTASMLRAGVAGEPVPPRRTFGALPDVAFAPEQAALLSVAAAATATVTFGSTLFGQNADYVGDTFGTDAAGLGTALAVTRVGVLLSLVASALADRLGRRRVIVWGTIGACATTGLSALAPTLALFTAAQVFNRGFVITTITVATIAAVEEAPEGARAFAASMMALAAGFGFALAVMTLPLADVTTDGWRISYVLATAGIVFVPKIARHLVETRRFRHLADAGVQRGRMSEVLSSRYGRRFVLLAAVGFLSNVFNAPSAQFTNKYLDDERGFSAAGISGFRAATGALPGIVGLLLAARLAETRGRRPVAVVGLLVGVATQMLFFLVGGPVLWISATVSVLGAASGGIALGTLGTELFPTEVRGTSNGLLLVVSVTGSMVGLLLAGFLADPLGGLGPAVALCGSGALVSTVLLVPRLPESQARLLDEVSPSEAAAPHEAGPGG